MIRKLNRKMKWISGIMAFIIALGLFGYYNREKLALWGFDLFLSDQVKEELQKSYKPIDGREAQNISYTDMTSSNPFTALLLGVDQRENETGRSDTMIVAVVRPKDKAVLMISIPRDTYTEIIGKDKNDKITHAYAYGGAKMSIETVENMFGITINHYAAINFNGFRNLIDAMGGISLPIGKDIVNSGKDHEKFVVKANQPSYNGQEALNYVRYREDAGGDVSRTGRQQAFLDAIMKKASSIGQWNDIPKYVSIMGDDFNTDMTPEMMVGLARTLLQSDNRTLYSHTLTGDGHRITPGGAWYYFVDEDDLAASTDLIESWLNPAADLKSLPLPSEYEHEKEMRAGTLSES
ncbi:LCP family protein [Paenibacillus xylaniclasticus]|uniref:LCP family protein n=1 Tax=Paenibacillus xylaniclasticus TaxID=588083 RepID=UPI00157FA435|nr:MULTISPECIES: LCP family protein [Paenibacillus]GFN31313.1 transcriptional regulator LytR [Paenibacillus curdlanolyticus]